MIAYCRVYWGSHGCDLERGHTGPHDCGCCVCPDHATSNLNDAGVMCVAKVPYYGPETNFYGEDVQPWERQHDRAPSTEDER